MDGRNVLAGTHKRKSEIRDDRPSSFDTGPVRDASAAAASAQSRLRNHSLPPAYDDLATGKMDLLFSPVEPLAPLRTQFLYADKFTCVISEGNSLKGEKFSLDQYLDSKHIVISVSGGQQILVDRPLAEAGYRRKICLRTPYFLPALAALRDTEYVLTTATRPIQPLLAHYGLRQVQAPMEIPSFNYPFNYLMVWHPRLDSEELHVWFRNLVRTTCEREFG